MDTFTPRACAEALDAARRVGVLTGAGLSTAAGVPDFRGPKGLYVTRAYDADRVFDLDAFDLDPEPFFAFSRDFLHLLDTVEPTFTHRFLARLEEEGKLALLATQNIDGLHERAGSRRVRTLHGDYRTARCRACARAFAFDEYAPTVRAGGVPHCGCGGVVKPDVVFFGEAVRGIEDALRQAASCDFFLVLGSSLAVFPAAAVPAHAAGPVAVVNRGAVPLAPGWRQADADLDVFFRDVAGCMGLSVC